MMFGSSLPPVVCRKAHVLFTLFVCVCVYWCPTYCVMLVFCLSSSCVPYVASFSRLPLRYSLMFIYMYNNTSINKTKDYLQTNENKGRSEHRDSRY